jgi:hypothetical protein
MFSLIHGIGRRVGVRFNKFAKEYMSVKIMKI